MAKNIFSTITIAHKLITSPEGSKAAARRAEVAANNRARADKILALLAAGEYARDGKYHKLNPGRTVQRVFQVLGFGVERAEVEASVPDLAQRFDAWAGCGEAILAAAREHNQHAAETGVGRPVSVDDVAHLFAIVEPGDKVVASEPELQAEAPTAAKSGKRTRKAA
jgi:hypothetical protein